MNNPTIVDLRPLRNLRAQIAALESQLGQAHERIAVLEAALRQAAGMKSIKGARAIVADALPERKEST